MTTEAPTAAVFREPLLRALGRLADLTPGVPIRMEDALAAVYDEAGYTEDQFGIDGPTNSPRLRVVLQQAFHKNLRPHGLADTEDRGMWSLTEEGVLAAKVLLGADPAPPPVFDGGGGVAWTLGKQVNTYNADPYIRSLAIAATPCFGEFSERSDVCDRCPVSGACKVVLMDRLAATGVQLRVRDSEARQKAEEAIKKANEPVPPKPPEPPDDDNIENIIAAIEATSAEARMIPVPASAKCFVCKEKVEKSTEPSAMHVPGRGLCHLHCHAGS